MKTKRLALGALVEYSSVKYNRSYAQSLFLFTLLELDFNKLIQLETIIKQRFINYCPSTLEEINKIIN